MPFEKIEISLHGGTYQNGNIRGNRDRDLAGVIGLVRVSRVRAVSN